MSSRSEFGVAWSKAEEAVLREKYGRVHAKTIGKELGRSTHAVMHRASHIGLQSRRRWTDEDKRTLRALWGERSLGQIAKELRRTVKTTYQMAKMLGLELGCPRGLEYLTAAAKRTGYTTGQLRSILKAQGVRLLPAFSRPTRARRHYHVVDPLDVDDAVARHVKAWPVQHAAREYGITGDLMRVWLLRARQASFDVPVPPTVKKGVWYVPIDIVAEVMTWRSTLESVREAARRTGLTNHTLRKRLMAAGVPRGSEKIWWVSKAAVDRVVAERTA